MSCINLEYSFTFLEIMCFVCKPWADSSLPCVHTLWWGNHLHWATEVWLCSECSPAGADHTLAPVHLLPHPPPGETCTGVQANGGRLGLLRSTSQCWWVSIFSRHFFPLPPSRNVSLWREGCDKTVVINLTNSLSESKPFFFYSWGFQYFRHGLQVHGGYWKIWSTHWHS